MNFIRPVILSACVAALAIVNVHAQQPASAPAKPRVVITADPELDDNDTLIRAMLYTTDWDVQGLVYQASGVHWKGDGKGTTQYRPGREYTRYKVCPEGCTSWRWPDKDKELFIDEIVDAYAKSYPNLRIHNPNYPDPAKLKSKIRWGNVDFEGDFSKDTDGSNLIKSLLLDKEPGPLYVTAQGGQSTIARALKSIYDQYHSTPGWATIRDKVSHKLVIIPFGDQDSTYASYIKPNWPDVTEWNLAMINYGYGIRSGLSPENQLYVSGAWTRANILDRGPLGALYRVWGDGKQLSKTDPTDYFGFSGISEEKLREMGYGVFASPQEKDSFISEGDTPTYLNLINNGLRAQNGYWGGWGGIRRDNAPRMSMGATPTILAIDDAGVAPGLGQPGVKNPNIPDTPPTPQTRPSGGFPRRAPLSPHSAAVNARFFAASENDFAARMKWSVTPNYKDANHEPKVTVKGPLDLTAKAGSALTLEGAVSDPDHNKVNVTWWQYNDAGTYAGDVHISDPATLKTSVEIPADAKPGDTIHIILEGTDDGTPALTQYQRVVITVK